ncbi:MAG TPA: glycosyltransferase 87 family protein [bacterium]|nr:glycosyltransferase 87 family protein [bacterium]
MIKINKQINFFIELPETQKNKVNFLLKIFWYLFNLLLIFLFLLFSFKILNIKEKINILFLTSLFLLFKPVIKNISNAKPSILILFFFISAFFFYFKKNYLISAFLFSLSSIFFPQIIFIYFIFIRKKNYRFAFLFLFLVIILNTFFLFFFNSNPIFNFLKNFLIFSTKYSYVSADNQSLLSLLIRTNIFIFHWQINFVYLFIFGNLLKLFFLFITLFFIIKNQNQNIFIMFAFLILSLLFFENNLNDYILLLMIFPFFILLKFINENYEKNIFLILIFFISYLLISYDINIEKNFLKEGILSLILSLKLFGLFLLWLINLFIIKNKN